jgi:DNA repair protein RecN (Recombination protein N)
VQFDPFLLFLQGLTLKIAHKAPLSNNSCSNYPLTIRKIAIFAATGEKPPIMIKKLLIRNYAIIDELEMDFSKGLTIITGETGAGKSILLGALGLVMGQRADTKALYRADEKCIVEAVFDLQHYDLQSFFEERDLEYEAELVIRREITPSGKSRAFVNDSPATLDVLQGLSGALIDLHQQFDTRDMYQVSFQLRLLDALADNKPLLTEYLAHFKVWQRNRRRLTELERMNADSNREAEFMRFQLEEFHVANLQEGEQEMLEQELEFLLHAEEIKKGLSAACHHLMESEMAVMNQLREVGASLAAFRRVNSKIGALADRYETSVADIQDVARELDRIADATEYDPERLAEVQQRLDLIYRLQNKHKQGSVAELIALQKNWEDQLRTLSNLDTAIEELQVEVAQTQQRLEDMAGQLRERRLAVIPGFEAEIKQMLGQLSMEHAVLRVQCELMDELSATGKDEVHFLFAANKGGRLQFIKDVASGGELTRLTLVTKSLVAAAIPLPTLIFDEIDSGVSGDVALRMGNILRRLSNQHQVVAITHSPQVASKADAHYFVFKKDTQERTVTNVRRLSQEERIRSIAVMLSQNPPSASALENARELLEMA